MSHFGRGSAGWWEVMRGDGKRAAALVRLRPEEEESRAWPMR
jgi:hypothetical protein